MGSFVYDVDVDDSRFLLSDSPKEISRLNAADYDYDTVNAASEMTTTITTTTMATTSEVAAASATEVTRPIVIPPCFFTCSATAKDSLVALKDAEKIRRKWAAISPPETPSELLVGETLALIVICVIGLALNLCAFYIGRKNGLKKSRIYMKVSSEGVVKC